MENPLKAMHRSPDSQGSGVEILKGPEREALKNLLEHNWWHSSQSGTIVGLYKDLKNLDEEDLNSLAYKSDNYIDAYPNDSEHEGVGFSVIEDKERVSKYIQKLSPEEVDALKHICKLDESSIDCDWYNSAQFGRIRLHVSLNNPIQDQELFNIQDEFKGEGRSRIDDGAYEYRHPESR